MTMRHGMCERLGMTLGKGMCERLTLSHTEGGLVSPYFEKPVAKKLFNTSNSWVFRLYPKFGGQNIAAVM